MSRKTTLLGLLALVAALATPAAARTKDPEPLPQRDTRLIAAAVDALPAQRSGTIDLYALGFAGDGSQDVFRNEIAYFPQLMRQRLQARGVITLINHLDSVQPAPHPLATYENLQQALAGIAKRMDPDEDILLLYLTMHGTPEHELAVYFPPFVEDALIPEDLRTVLDDAGIRHRVLVISACYSGGFIRELRDPDTLLITAARADRASFGCDSESNVTWFGRAWLVEGLNQENDLLQAYEYATRRVHAWEQAEKVEASFPQMAAGKRIRQRLRQWQAQSPLGEAVAYPYPIEDLDAKP